VVHVGETGLGGDPFGPRFHGPALHLDAAAAVAAGQVVMVHGGPALPVQRLAVGVADRVHAALLVERLQVPVDGGQPDVLAHTAQLGVDLLRAAEAGQGLEHGRQRLGLLGAAGARAATGGRRPDPHLVPRLLRLRRGHSRTVHRCRPSG
jgi:hypothetical protein